MAAEGGGANAARRAAILSGAAAVSAPLLLGKEALAVWEELEDDDGSSVWVDSETGEESKVDPSKKKKRKAKTKAAEESEGAGAGAGVKAKDDVFNLDGPKMATQLTKYSNVNRGFTMKRPNGWNEFDSAPGQYDVKWEDLVEKTDLVMVGTTPLRAATSVDTLGDVTALGEQLAKKKKATLVDAQSRTKDGTLFYTFVFKAGQGGKGAVSREVYQLCVNRGSLWSVTATTSEKKWSKRKDLYAAIMASFSPKL